ncbi:MAG: phosphoribosyl-AMP cyclohydrolase [Clostridiaceae bacterium]|jgi:phosphoribosyl-AMP cyclohydrolase|nr:phosphoribosyl-AMP cyclohydrolase [Clostridiaceae bacterium]
MILKDLRFNEQGLIPVIVQDMHTKDVLMMAWMNQEALEQTLRTGMATYWSRSRGKLWVKGETSGHFQTVHKIWYDCDGDTLLLSVVQRGVACHTGSISCFYREIPFMEVSKDAEYI